MYLRRLSWRDTSLHCRSTWHCILFSTQQLSGFFSGGRSSFRQRLQACVRRTDRAFQACHAADPGNDARLAKIHSEKAVVFFLFSVSFPGAWFVDLRAHIGLSLGLWKDPTRRAPGTSRSSGPLPRVPVQLDPSFAEHLYHKNTCASRTMASFLSLSSQLLFINCVRPSWLVQLLPVPATLSRHTRWKQQKDVSGKQNAGRAGVDGWLKTWTKWRRAIDCIFLVSSVEMVCCWWFIASNTIHHVKV